jgi:rare lipoprotein A (peptidoglycan hydrolase)
MHVNGYVKKIVVCLCIFGSTKSINAFDFSNSTVIETNVISVQRTSLKGQTVELIRPPQPRDKRGRLVCTSNRYVRDERQVGEISWYGNEFDGQKTASGERFNKNAYTIAHLTLPMGTKVLVVNPRNNKSAEARVNDCGPYIKGRIADLSYGLAKQLGFLDVGDETAVLIVL